jgi:hypothetical protein
MTFDTARLYRDLIEGANYLYAASDSAASVERAADYYGRATALVNIATSIRNGDYDE